MVGTFGQVLEHAAETNVAALAVDIPLGLPVGGRRAADVEARRRLGSRASTLFPTPAHAVLGATDHADAVARSRAATGRGISIQAYNLLDKMIDARTGLAGWHGCPVRECHPETTLVALGGEPLPSKKTARGAGARMKVLAPHFPDLVDALAHAPSGLPVDDAIDATIAAWTARRMATGGAELIGDPDAHDPDGFAMTIAV